MILFYEVTSQVSGHVYFLNEISCDISILYFDFSKVNGHGLKPSQYAKSRTNGNGISVNVTNKNHKFQVTHQINLSNSPPTCSNCCLRLYGTPCSEMCVYSKYTNQDIIALLSDKYKSPCQHHLLDLSLPDNHPALNIDNDSLSVLHDPIIILPFSKAPRVRTQSRRL